MKAQSKKPVAKPAKDTSPAPEPVSRPATDGSPANANESTGAGTATPQASPPMPQPATPASPPPVPWWQFIRESSDADIKQRFVKELKQILDDHASILSSYVVVAILSPADSIDSFESDRIFTALAEGNMTKEKDVLLLLLSPGGSIEPAYQISTLCKAYAKSRFVSVVPRRAKSAATLIAIGADEIHMGPLSQLGPIDPQLGGLPALGVVQAIERIASLAEKFPGSSEMFARYLKLALTVEQIGYCERIGESAVQYAIRLLGTKASLKGKEQKIANDLVYEYKDHGFVIDLHEAQGHLGASWVKTDTPELQCAEKLYRLFEDVNLYLNLIHKKRLAIIGSITSDPIIMQSR